MSKHLYGLIVTAHGVAANNRGETEGNITTLQKLLWNGEVHTTVSAEAIRWAIRYYWQCSDIPVNRVWNEEANDHEWQDQDWSGWAAGNDGTTYIDDDVLGFMRAEAAKQEGNAAESGKGRGKGTAITRRGVLEVTRAISLTPYAGDITFNSKSGEKTSTSLYGTEVHATRFQYGFAMTPEFLREPRRVLDVVDALVGLSEVGGNQSRFLFDFSPDAVVFRWTDDFAPRLLYAFSLNDSGVLEVPDIVRRVKARDIEADELIVGGRLADSPDGKVLQELGARVFRGVKPAAEDLKIRIGVNLGLGG